MKTTTNFTYEPKQKEIIKVQAYELKTKNKKQKEKTQTMEQ